MLYEVMAKFGPSDEERWSDYIWWRGLHHLTRFDSVDSILRPSLFVPKTDQDWQHCVSADFKIGLITDVSFATSILSRYEDAEIVGVELEVDQSQIPGLHCVGYDIIDGYCDVSLLTNWGTDEEGRLRCHQSNGLLDDLGRALAIRDTLRVKFSHDSHAKNCSVWAIYRIGTEQSD